jgi:hypothetical protein
MNLFHRHQWEETERFYAPAIAENVTTNFSGQGAAEIMQRAIFGFTTILYRCPCKAVKTIEILGGRMSNGPIPENRLGQVTANGINGKVSSPIGGTAQGVTE